MERRRRTTAGVVGVVVGGLVVLSIIMGLRSRTIPRPATPITPFTVSSLRVAWTDDTGASINSPPTVVGDRVYVTNSAGKVLAYPSTCPLDSETCRPVWTADLRKASFGYGGPGAGEGMVFAASSDGRLVGYPQACGPGTCAPTWIARPGGDLTAAAPVVADGRVYVGSDDGTFSAYPVRCSSYPQPCPARWTARLRGGYGRADWSGAQPVIADGVVYVGSTGGSLYAFPTSCRVTCEPSRVLDLSGPLANPLVLYGDTLYVTAGQDLDAIPTRCLATGASCGPRWIGRATSLIVSMPQIDDGNVFVGSTDGTVSVFPIACGGGGQMCDPSWSIEGLGRLPNPTVVNGVLFVGSTWAVNELFAYDADCGGAGGACEPLWHYVSTDLGAFQQPQALTDDGTLIAVTGDPIGGGPTGAGGFIFGFRVP